MTVSSSTQIPKTSDPAVFQRQCKVLFERVLKDPNVQEFGSSGQGQGGVDILGRRRDISLDHWVGIQCKLTIKAQKLKKGIVGEEATKALEYQPALKEYIIATTAEDDAALHAEATAFTDAQAKQGRDFTVQVWGWGTLVTHVLQYEPAIEAFSPDAFPHLKELKKGQDRLVEQAETLGTNQIAMVTALQRIEQQTAVSAGIVSSSAVWDDSSVGTLLDSQIDRFREMLNSGQPRTALSLLENLWEGLPSGIEGRIRFRIRSNIAAAKLRLGDEEAAGNDYLDAFDFAPDDPKAVALKVLGLVLLKRQCEAWEFGLAHRDISGDRAPLFAHLTTAARKLPEDTDPFAITPPELETNPTVEIARIDYLYFKPDRGSWIELAREAHARHPDDQNITRLAAEADIADAIMWSDDNARGALPPEIRARVEAAVVLLREDWGSIAAAENSTDGFALSLCTNLSIGYRLLYYPDLAMEIVEQGLKRHPDNQTLIELQFVIALEKGDPDTAARLVDKIPRSRDAVFGRLQIFANKGDWASIEALTETADLSQFETDDRAYFESLILLARTELGRVDGLRACVEGLLRTYPEQAIVPTILYEVAKHERDFAWATELYKAALERRESLNGATRLMLARVAEREGDADTVIDLLVRRVATDRDSEGLQLLSRGFVNAKPRRATLEFMESLSEDIKATPFYARVVGSINFNSGALDAAEGAFQAAIGVDPSDLVAHLGLINTWLRQDRRDCVEEHLARIDPNKLHGPPVQKLGLAQLLAAFGRPEVALALGYETALNNRDELRVVQLYIGLILPDLTGISLPTNIPEIGIDSWVHLTRGDAQSLNVVIEIGQDRPSIDHYSPGHPLAKVLLGHKPGDEIVLPAEIGSGQSWRIGQIKHKYLALLHEITTTLQSRFPEARGFYQFEIKGDDLSPIFEQVRTFSEHESLVLDNYLKNSFPIALAAAVLGKSSIEFAGSILRRGEVIRTCVGTYEEREQAVRLLRESADRGIVLDTYTAWTAHSLDVISVLKSLFHRVALPQSSLDELRQWRDRYRQTPDGEPLMTLAFVDGEYVRQEFTPEEMARSAALIGEGSDVLARELEILPAVAPSEPSKLETAILDLADHGVLDPAYVGVSEDLLLLSEDLQYRNLAYALYRKPNAWLQAALMLAADTRKMTGEAYSRAVTGLAIQKHNLVSVNAATLLAIASADDTDGLQKFKAIAESIGGPAADLESHFAVSWGFLNAIWTTDLPLLRRSAASSAILERLVPLLAKHDQLNDAYRAMLNDARPLLRDHLIRWSRGHFLHIQPESKAPSAP